MMGVNLNTSIRVDEFNGLVLEGHIAGSTLTAGHRFHTVYRDGHPPLELRYVGISGRGFWVIDDMFGDASPLGRAVDILASREWLEVAYKQGFRDAADYENLNRVSDADLEAAADQHWHEFKA